MTRQVLILDLEDDPELIAQYERAHAAGQVPEAVVRSIRESGITAMDIHRSGNRLVMVMETDARFDPEEKARSDAENPAVQDWERRMDRLQKRLPWAAADQKWVPAARIFSLGEQ